jgi:hypothetical protein
MSYTIFRGVKFENDKIYFRAASNNVWPRDYSWTEEPSISKKIKSGEATFEEIEKNLLWQVLNGSGGVRLQIQKYKRAVARTKIFMKEELDSLPQDAWTKSWKENPLYRSLVNFCHSQIGKTIKGKFVIFLDGMPAGFVKKITKNGAKIDAISSFVFYGKQGEDGLEGIFSEENLRMDGIKIYERLEDAKIDIEKLFYANPEIVALKGTQMGLGLDKHCLTLTQLIDKIKNNKSIVLV